MIRNGRDVKVDDETTVYKLTDQRQLTHGGYQWEIGRTCTVSGDGPLCGPGHLHVYTSAPLALLMAPAHVPFWESPRLFVAHGIISGIDRGRKVGCRELTLTAELAVPAIKTSHRIAFGILAAWESCEEASWRDWAQRWLDGTDRSYTAAAAAASTAAAAASTAASAASSAAAYAAAYTASAAANAAYCAANAAIYADDATVNLDLIAARALGIVPN